MCFVSSRVVSELDKSKKAHPSYSNSVLKDCLVDDGTVSVSQCGCERSEVILEDPALLSANTYRNSSLSIFCEAFFSA